MIGNFDGLADDLADCAKKGEKRTRGKIKTEYEDPVVGRFLQSFEDAVLDYSETNPYDVEIETYKLKDAGKNSPETKYGGDFVIGFNLQLPDFSMSHGIITQAKRQNTDWFPDMATIRKQSNKMLEWSPDSFVNIMSSRSYRMYPAVQIVKSKGKKPTYKGTELEFENAFDYLTTLKFYKLFFRGHIGDNWVYQNIDFLTNRNIHTPKGRPLVPDGGESFRFGQNHGVKALVIVVKDSGLDIEYPFDLENTVESFDTERSFF